MKKILLSSLLLLVSHNTIAANKLLIFSDFSNVQNSSNDTYMHKGYFKTLVLNAYSNSSRQVEVVETKPVGVPYLHLQVMYTYVSQIDARFSSIVFYNRDKNGSAICDYHSTFWWVGQTGQGKVQQNAEDNILLFKNECGARI